MTTPAYMDPKKTRYLTIHCAATPEGRDVKAETISHWDIQKFGQVSYHAVCQLDGTIVETLRDNQRGAHTGGANTGNLGLCYVGGMDAKMKAPKDTRTPAQKSAMAAYIRRKLKEYPGLIIRGHRDWPGVKKACPSFEVKTWLKAEGLI